MSKNGLHILAGSARRGTMWLQDVLCQANDLGAIFEPRHPAADAPLLRLSPQQKEDIERALKMFQVTMYDTSSIQPQQNTIRINQPWAANNSLGELA